MINHIKRKIIGIFLLFPLIVCAHTSIKGNLTTLIGIPNFGFETALGKHTTFQVDMTASFGTTNGLPYKSTSFFLDIFVDLKEPVSVAPYKFAILMPELRYYLKESGYGFYVGAHLGGGKYKLQKWNHPEEYENGYSFFMGITTGYQFRMSDRINLELFIGGGNQQGFYKGYSLATGERGDGAEKYNKSGEWLPYRGGLMLVYKIKSKGDTI